MVKSDNRFRFWVGAGFIQFLVLILYRSVFSAEYVWDDSLFFIDSTVLRQPDNFFATILEPIIATTSYFRPAVMGSFVVEFQLFGVSSSISHAVNLAFHLCNVTLVALMAWRLIAPGSVVAALLATAFYALHPSIIESVAWVSGRFDVLVTFFTLLAMVATVYLKRGYRLIVIPGCFFLAACSKEMAISFPIVWCLLLWLREFPSLPLYLGVISVLRTRWLEALLILVAGVAYLALRIHFIPNVFHLDQNVVTPFFSLDRWFLVFNTLFFYVQLAVFPFSDISPIHPLITYIDVPNLMVGGGLALILVYCLVRIVVLPARDWLLFILLGTIALSPVLNIIPLTIAGNIGHDRFLAMPLSLWALAIGLLLSRALSIPAEVNKVIRPGVVTISMVWILAAVLNLNLTVPLWNSNLSLWSWAYARFPEPELVRTNLLSGLMTKGLYPQARKLVEDVRVNVKTPLGDMYEVQESILYIRTGESERALDILERLETNIGIPPHIRFVVSGRKLEEGFLGNNSGVRIWLYRGLYGALSEAHLSLRHFERALDYADIALFYQHTYPPLMLLKAMAELGKGDIEAGKAQFLASKAAIAPWTKEEPAMILGKFLEGFCITPEGGGQMQDTDALQLAAADNESSPAAVAQICADPEAFVAELNSLPY